MLSLTLFQKHVHDLIRLAKVISREQLAMLYLAGMGGWHLIT